MAGVVDTVWFLFEVVAPVVREGPVRDQDAECQDRFCSVQAPAAGGNVEPVGHDVADGSLDDAGGDRPPARKARS